MSRGVPAIHKSRADKRNDTVKAGMVSKLDFHDSEIPSEKSPEHPNDSPTLEPPSAEVSPRQANIIRRKKRRRNFAPPLSEYSIPSPVPVYIPQESEQVASKHRRRSRRRERQRNRRRVWRRVLFVSIQIAFILLLIFLWMKVSGNVSQP